MPSFYLVVSGMIDEGIDAFVINRRTITDRYTEPSDIPLMYAQAGEPHPGHDCFVYRRDAYPNYLLGRVCVGAPWVGRVLLLNLIAFADRFEEFKDLHATFHIGDAQVWQGDRFAGSGSFNHAEATKGARSSWRASSRRSRQTGCSINMCGRRESSSRTRDWRRRREGGDSCEGRSASDGDGERAWTEIATPGDGSRPRSRRAPR